MDPWVLEVTETYERRYKEYEKKHPNELVAVANNLDSYFKALNRFGHPLQVKAGFIHDEPEGIKAVDQKGGGQKVKLQQTRLYIYPDLNTRTVHVLTMGDKSSQKEDIKFCREHVKKEIRGRQTTEDG